MIPREHNPQMGELLTKEQLEALPLGTWVRVYWGGQIGPYDYRLTRDRYGRLRAEDCIREPFGAISTDRDSLQTQISIRPSRS